MSGAIRLGLIATLLGAALAYGPVLLPREWFGELGHGDGMGLIGISMFGFLIFGLGLIVLVFTAAAKLIPSKNSQHNQRKADL